MTRRTDYQTNAILDKIHHQQALGFSNNDIMKDLELKERDFFRLTKKLRQRTFEKYMQQKDEDYFEDVERCKERVMSTWINARARARAPDSHPSWGALETELEMLLFRIEKEGLVAINNYRLKQLEQKAGSRDMDVRPIVLQTTSSDDKQPADSSSESRQEGDTSQYKF